MTLIDERYNPDRSDPIRAKKIINGFARSFDKKLDDKRELTEEEIESYLTSGDILQAIT